MCWVFGTSWDQEQGHPAWSYLCLLPQGSSPLVCALSLEHSGNEACIWRKGWFMKDYSETHPQERPNPGVRAAGYGKCPVPGSQAALSWGTAGKAGLQPPPKPWSACPSWLAPSAVRGYWIWPANIQQELWHCMASHWLGHNAVALSSVHREVCAIVKPGHALHHPCAQEDMQTDGLISHIPLPNSLMPEVKDDLGGSLKSPLYAYTKDFNTNHVPLQEVPQRGPWGSAVGLYESQLLFPCRGAGPQFDPHKSQASSEILVLIWFPAFKIYHVITQSCHLWCCVSSFSSLSSYYASPFLTAKVVLKNPGEWVSLDERLLKLLEIYFLSFFLKEKRTQLSQTLGKIRLVSLTSLKGKDSETPLRNQIGNTWKSRAWLKTANINSGKGDHA